MDSATAVLPETPLEINLKTELQSVQNKWHGGYLEGHPLDPMAPSAYQQLGYISMLHATYLRCIKPYIKPQTVVLELGPGRGAWTKCLLPAKEIYALDALSAQHNGIFEYLGNPTNLKYFHVSDFECDMIPDSSLDYLFSHGCLCHVSFAGITRYAERLFAKLKRGADCFWMVGDAGKYNNAYLRHGIWEALARMVPAQGQQMVAQLRQMGSEVHSVPADQTEQEGPGKWYPAGGARTCEMLKGVGYEIVDSDVGTNLRDPIIYFRKP
jgi:hypothetical protein